MAWWNRGGKNSPVDKAGRVTTPPGKVQRPKYADKKIVKAVKPTPPKKGK
jgi:hypothetical protein